MKKILGPPETDPFRHGPRFHHHHHRYGAVIFHDRDGVWTFEADDLWDRNRDYTHVQASKHRMDHEDGPAGGVSTPCRRRDCPLQGLDGDMLPEDHVRIWRRVLTNLSDP